MGGAWQRSHAGSCSPKRARSGLEGALPAHGLARSSYHQPTTSSRVRMPSSDFNARSSQISLPWLRASSRQQTTSISGVSRENLGSHAAGPALELSRVETRDCRYLGIWGQVLVSELALLRSTVHIPKSTESTLTLPDGANRPSSAVVCRRMPPCWR